MELVDSFAPPPAHDVTARELMVLVLPSGQARINHSESFLGNRLFVTHWLYFERVNVAVAASFPIHGERK